MKILGQGVQNGVKVENRLHPQIFVPQKVFSDESIFPKIGRLLEDPFISSLRRYVENRYSRKISGLILVICRFGGLIPKLSPQFPDAIGDFVAVDVLVATRYFSSRFVKYSLR